MSAAMVRPTRFRLGSVTIRGFRAVAGEARLLLEGRSGLLRGDNGAGKSTFALALQWVLYGRFPSGVLQNTLLDRFLTPVQAREAAPSGEVVLLRGDEELVVSREGAKRFEVRLGGVRWTGAEAERRRDALLGLDMDSFVRVVLLQQSRIRSLLLDDPKERNRALDRLLGMDALEHLLALLRPRDLAKAAEACRQKIRLEQQRLLERERLLGEQLEEAQARARGLGFSSKDLNPTGLRTRYEELGRDLAALGRKHQVELPELPACAALADAALVSRAFARSLQQLRLASQPRLRLAQVLRASATLTALRDAWDERWSRREAGRGAVEEHARQHGDEEGLGAEKIAVERRSAELREQLRSASALRQLLADAAAFVEKAGPAACPVCEAPVAGAASLLSRIEERAAALASDEIASLERERRGVEARLQELGRALARAREIRAELAACDGALERQREKVAEALGAGVAEGKVRVRLDEALAAAEATRAALGADVAAVEAELQAIDLRERALREGLLPVMHKREEVAALERASAGAKATHRVDEQRATALEHRAAELDTIRRALLEAKTELAGDSLRRAGPRAQELYARLVRHPCFDQLRIQTAPRADKVDYAFQVSAGGASVTARDARLVLSDGQLTATALSLFLGLAESTEHELDLLYVDDPTQNLDLRSKEAMARVIAEIAARKQVVVSTHDEDFVSFLQAEGFGVGATLHHLGRRMGDLAQEPVVTA